MQIISLLPASATLQLIFYTLVHVYRVHEQQNRERNKERFTPSLGHAYLT